MCTDGWAKTGVSSLLERGDGDTWRRAKEGDFETFVFSKKVILTFLCLPRTGVSLLLTCGEASRVDISGSERTL